MRACLFSAHTPLFVALAVAVVATGSLATYPSYLALPPRWFDRHLGLALAFASTGIGVGFLVLPHVVTASLESVGSPLTFVVVGLIALVVGIASFAIFIRDNKGPIPKNEVRKGSAPDQCWDAKAGVPFGEAVRTFDFWAFSAGFSLVFFITVGINFHFAALIADGGNSPAEAAAGVVGDTYRLLQTQYSSPRRRYLARCNNKDKDGRCSIHGMMETAITMCLHEGE